MSLRADYSIGCPSVDAMMEELIEGVEFLNQLRRYFPAKSVDADSHRIIFDAIAAAYRVYSGTYSAPKRLDHNRCSLVFSKDYRSCQCYMRLSKTPTEFGLWSND
jgi:hypothetical protein